MPDIILLDVLFAPDVNHGGLACDGFQILDWLRRIAPIEDTTVILVTAQDPASYAERARAVGAAELVQKTVEPAVCIDLIHRLLDKPSVAAQYAHELQGSRREVRTPGFALARLALVAGDAVTHPTRAEGGPCGSHPIASPPSHSALSAKNQSQRCSPPSIPKEAALRRRNKQESFKPPSTAWP